MSGISLIGAIHTTLLCFLPSTHDHQPSANGNQNLADVWRQKFVVMGVDAEVDVSGVDAVALGVRNGHKKGKNSKHKYDCANCK